MAADAIVLRRLEPADGPEIARLSRESPENTGAIALHGPVPVDHARCMYVIP